MDNSSRQSRTYNPIAATLAIVLLAALFLATRSVSAHPPRDPLTVTIAAPAAGQTLSGSVVWAATTTGNTARVDFLVDGKVQWTESSAPYYFNGDPNGRLDTTRLANGQHVLKAIVYSPLGLSASQAITVSVANGSAPSTPAPAPAPSGVPQVSIRDLSDGQTVSGSIPWTAAASGATPARITFAIDGQLKWTEKYSPFMYNGDPAGRLDTTTLSNGAHVLAASAFAADGRSTSLSITITVANGGGTPTPVTAPAPVPAPDPAAPPPPTSSDPAPSGGTGSTGGSTSSAGGSWLGWSVPSVPSGSIAVTSESQLEDLLQTCPTPGANYDATRLSVSISSRTIVKGQCPDGRPETFFLGPNVKFVKSDLSGDPAVDVTMAQNIVIYGGDITNPQGTGISVRGYGRSSSSSGTPTRKFTWWGFTVHDTAQGGLFVSQQSGDVQNVDLRGDISRWSLNLSMDPHNAKGTGLHGAYIGTTTSTGAVSGSTFVLHVHDGQYGSGVQLGPNLQSNVFQVRAENLPCNPPSGADGTCGNALTIFGDSQNNNRVTDVEGTNVRRVVETSGLYSSVSSNAFAVTYGRGTNVRLSPAFLPDSGVTYSNIS